jgi:hypothetical protein
MNPVATCLVQALAGKGSADQPSDGHVGEALESRRIRARAEMHRSARCCPLPVPLHDHRLRAAAEARGHFITEDSQGDSHVDAVKQRPCQCKSRLVRDFPAAKPTWNTLRRTIGSTWNVWNSLSRRGLRGGSCICLRCSPKATWPRSDRRAHFRCPSIAGASIFGAPLAGLASRW